MPPLDLVNLYGSQIPDVELRRDVVVGRNVTMEAFAFLPSRVTIEEGALIGPMSASSMAISRGR